MVSSWAMEWMDFARYSSCSLTWILYKTPRYTRRTAPRIPARASRRRERFSLMETPFNQSYRRWTFRATARKSAVAGNTRGAVTQNSRSIK